MHGGRRGKNIALCLALLLLAGLCAPAQAANGEEAGKHSTTVMVYLCGGDLERFFGAATEDIREMAGSGFDSRYTTLLIMADGMGSRKDGPDAGKTVIIEIGAHGMRTVRHSEKALNMADGETLKTFLDYGYVQYPAERHALILWGHGGGPLEGMVCDGQTDGDSLSLEDIRAALDESFPAREKLSWIGFDACLMATLETALSVADYADCMIASQAREESSGWNYSFLRGLERDEDGAATARRIFRASAGSAAEDLQTLSCIRLDRIGALREETDRYFGTLCSFLTEDSAAVFLKNREKAAAFGSMEDGAQDLVDLVSLSEQWEPVPGCGEALRNAVREAVICSEATVAGANGISVFCPDLRENEAAERWTEYSLRFGYLFPDYIRFFSALFPAADKQKVAFSDQT